MKGALDFVLLRLVNGRNCGEIKKNKKPMEASLFFYGENNKDKLLENEL